MQLPAQIVHPPALDGASNYGNAISIDTCLQVSAQQPAPHGGGRKSHSSSLPKSFATAAIFHTNCGKKDTIHPGLAACLLELLAAIPCTWEIYVDRVRVLPDNDLPR